MVKEEHFRSLVLTGLFQTNDVGCLSVLKEDGEVINLDKELVPFVGRNVKMVLHFNPVTPDPTKRGMGCCHWDNPQDCPAGHNDDPGKMLVFQAQGEMTDIPVWAVGGVVLPFDEVPGHDTRLVLATDFKMPKNMSANDLSSMMDEIAGMRLFLEGVTAGIPKGKR